jgi:hypothetical protein
VEHFGDKRINVAYMGTLYSKGAVGAFNRRVPEIKYYSTVGWRLIVLSGGLWAYLYNCGVKRLLMPQTESPMYSAKGEPVLEPERRFADLKTGKEDRAARIKMWWQKKNDDLGPM